MKRSLKILIAVLVMTLAVCAFCVSVFASNAEGKEARVGVTFYDTVEEAISAASDGDRVVLLSDVTLDNPLVFSKSIKLDLGGKTLTGTENKYMFTLNVGDIDVTVMGEGKIYAKSNLSSSTQLGMVNIPDRAASSSISFEGSFDGITFYSEGGAYIALNTGTVNFDNVSFYSPSGDSLSTLYNGVFEVRKTSSLNMNRVVFHKTVSDTSSKVVYRFDSIIDVQDSASVTINNSYLQSPTKGINVRHNSDLGTDKEHRYLVVTSSTLDATHARTELEYAWKAENTNGVQTGWRTEGGKGYAVAMNIIGTNAEDNPVGIAEFDSSDIRAAWRTFVHNATVSPDSISHKIIISNSDLYSYNQLGATLTQAMLDERKAADGDKASTYTYPAVGSYIIANEPCFVRGTGAKFYLDNCNLTSGSETMFWDGDDSKEKAYGYDLFILNTNVRMNRAIATSAEVTVQGYGKFGVDATSGSVSASSEFPYAFVRRAADLNSNDGYYAQVKYRTNASTDIKTDGITNANLAPIQQSFENGGLNGGKYVKWKVVRPTSANNAYYSSGGDGYVDSDTLKLGGDSYSLFRGKYGDGTVALTQLYDVSSGKRLFKYLAYDISFKTDSTFLTNNTNISSRNEYIGGDVTYNENTLYFYEDASGSVYLRTTDQKNQNQKGLQLTRNKGSWYHLTVVIELAENTGTKYTGTDTAKRTYHSTAHYYIDGKYFASQDGVLATGTAWFDGARFNTTAYSSLDIGETICFDNYSVRTEDEMPLIDLVSRDSVGDTLVDKDLAEFDSAVGGSFKYFDQDGNENGVSVDTQNSTLSAIKGVAENGYVKAEIQVPTEGIALNSNNAAVSGNSVTPGNGLDSFMVFKGWESMPKLYDKDTGTSPLYDYIVAEIDIMTTTAYPFEGSNISIRFQVGGSTNTTSGHQATLYFVEEDGVVYLRQYGSVHVSGSGIALKGANNWQRISMVIKLEELYSDSKIWFYVDGEYLGMLNNPFQAADTDPQKYVPQYFDGMRFNFGNNKTYTVGENICFDNYTVRAYNLGLDDPKSYVDVMADVTAATTVSGGVYGNYITAPNGNKLYGDYYTDVSAALLANADKYTTVDLLANASGVTVTDSIRIKETKGKLTNYTVADTLGFTVQDGVYTFSDTYTSVVTRSYGKLSFDSDYSTKDEALELPIGQPIPASPTADVLIESNDAADDNIYKSIGFATDGTKDTIITAVPEECVTVYEVYSANAFVIYGSDGSLKERSFDVDEFVAKFNALASGDKLVLRNDVIYSGDEQFNIVAKEITLDLGGHVLAIERLSDTEDKKHLFRFANTAAEDKSTLNITSSVAGANVITKIKGSNNGGAIFYIVDNAKSNVINVLDNNVTFASSAILDARGADTVFDAKGGRFIKSGTDYSGVFLARPNAPRASFTFDSCEFVMLHTGSVFNLLESTAEVRVSDSVFAGVNPQSTNYLAYIGGGTTAVEGQTDPITNPYFSGTITLTDVKSNIILASSIIENAANGSETGTISLTGSCLVAPAKQIVNSTTTNYVYFANENGITYNGVAFENARFTRVDEAMTLGGSDTLSYVSLADGGVISENEVELTAVYEASTIPDGTTFVKWVRFDESTAIAMNTDAVNDNSILTSTDAPYALPSDKANVYTFSWKVTGDSSPEALSITSPLYAINLESYTLVEAKSFDAFTVSYNLSISDDFSYNIYIPKSLVDAGGDIVYTLEGNTVNLLDSATLENVEGVAHYKLTYSGVSAYKAAQSVNLKISIPIDGTASSHVTSFTYSVTRYSDTVMEGEYSDECKQMLADMLAYVKAAYEYAGESVPAAVTDSLTTAAGKGFTPSSFALATEAENASGISAFISGATINVSNSAIKFRFVFASGVTTSVKLSYVKVGGSVNETVIETENGVITKINGESVENGGNFYDLSMKVYDFNSDINITVDTTLNGSFTDSNDINTSYNSASYVEFIGSGNAADIVKALYTYAESAKAYRVELINKQ